MLKKILYLSICYTLLVVFPVALTGCGQTGPLYLPDKTETGAKS